MSGIHLTTFVSAPADRVFDLARSIGIYKALFQSRKEKLTPAALGNVIQLNEGFSIEATHFKKSRVINLYLSKLEKPTYFLLQLKKGNLQAFSHEHYVKEVSNGSLLIDKITYALPDDFVGKMLGKFYMNQWLESLIESRNKLVKQYAESEKWRMVLV